MRYLYSIMLFSMLICANLQAQSKVWIVDQNNSSVRFTVNHMMISEIGGTFQDFFASVDFNEEDITNSKFYVTMSSKSIDTGLSLRDQHLKSSDFFDVDKFPELRFKSTGIREISRDHYRIKGTLTVKDRTKDVEVDLAYGGIATDYWGNRRAGFKITGSFNRFDFGLEWNELLEAGGLIVGEDVNVNVSLELFQQTEIQDLADIM